MEAAAHGIGMCYPYGAWMGRYARDAFYAPRKTAEEVQTFLYDNEQYFGKKSGYNVLVLYDYRSNVFRDWQSGQGELLSVGDTEDLLSYTISYDDRASWVPYFEIGKKLIDRRVPFDVAILGDGGLTTDTLTAQDLAPYDIIVSADCGFLTKNQAALLREAAGKKKLFIFGAYAENLSGEADAAVNAGAILRPCGPRPKESAREFCRDIDEAYASLRVLDWDNGNIYVQQSMAASSTVLHIFNYDFNRETHRANEGKVTVILRHKPPELVRALTLDGQPVRLEYAPAANGSLLIRLSRLPCYTMIIIR
jgi:hypothetical protein